LRQACFEREANLSNVEVSRGASLYRARFKGSCTLDESIISGYFYALEARFEDTASFRDISWDRDVYFEDATFGGKCRFMKARFRGPVFFGGAEFSHETSFISAIFEDWAEFGDTRFTRADTGIDFREVTFSGRARFSEATFAGDAIFLRATFEQEARFRGTTFHSVDFSSVTFKGTVQLGLLASTDVILDDASFEHHGQITVTARRFSCMRSRFPSGGHLRVIKADFSLEEADISGPLIVSGHAELPDDLRPSSGRPEALAVTGSGQGQPVLYSLKRANVAGLVLTGVSLRRCRFEGAQNLDLLRVEGGDFARAASRLPWDWRRVIAEEATWRGGGYGWHAESWPDWMTSKSIRLPALQIAATYRALRKGKEDTKDEPGATDFYYGEMEMRRRATKRNSEPEQASSYTPFVERMILHAYWLISGYGLRAWRAVIATVLALLLFAFLFTHGGFATDVAHCARPSAGTTCDNSFGYAVIFGARTGVGLPTDPRPVLTALGQVEQIALRIIVPVLLGLALLAIRGRVKR
jgi:uncharacterized protein YjbI with pentapeptide repeats